MVVIDGTPIDIATSVTYSAESETTSFPVEEGADLTDHVRVGQLKIELECVVSDTPIGAVAADPSRSESQASSGGTVPSNAYGMAIFHRLLEIRDARKPVTVTTSRGDFENMVLSFEVPDDLSTSGGLAFTASLVQIQVAQNERVTVAATPRGQGKVNRGPQALKSLGETWLNPLVTLPTIVFTIRPLKAGEQKAVVDEHGVVITPAANETKYWEQNPKKIPVSSDAYGLHYVADSWTFADGVVDDIGRYKPISRKSFAAMPTFMRKWLGSDRAVDAATAHDQWVKAYRQRVGAGGAPVNGPLRGNRF